MPSGFTWDAKKWEELRKLVPEMKDLYVAIGLQGEKGTKKHKDSDLTNAQIGAVHEFNAPTDTPPGRPFIRPVYDAEPDVWKVKLGDVARRVMLKKEKPKGGLRKVGEEYRKRVIDRMKAGIDPPLAESTINQRKGQNTQAKRARLEKRAQQGKKGMDTTPLIDTGALMGAISVEVLKK